MKVSTLWIGKLGSLEIISLKSFLHHKHEVDLYVYEPLENIPDGVNVCDANDVLSKNKCFELKDNNLPFSDIWRYNFLYKIGGIWVDADMICLKSLEPLKDIEYIFSSERTIQKGALVLKKSPKDFIPNIGILKAPQGSEFYRTLIEKCLKIKNNELTRYMKALQKHIENYQYEKYILEPNLFCPVDWWNAKEIYTKPIDKWREKYGVIPHIYNDKSYCLHMWRNLARKYKINFDNSVYAPNTIYNKYLNEFF